MRAHKKVCFAYIEEQRWKKRRPSMAALKVRTGGIENDGGVSRERAIISQGKERSSR